MAKDTDKPRRLIPIAWAHPLQDDNLEEVLLRFAINMEDVLLTAGALPGRDYDYLRLFDLARPCVLDYIRRHDKWSAGDFLLNVRLCHQDD